MVSYPIKFQKKSSRHKIDTLTQYLLVCAIEYIPKWECYTNIFNNTKKFGGKFSYWLNV